MPNEPNVKPEAQRLTHLVMMRTTTSLQLLNKAASLATLTQVGLMSSSGLVFVHCFDT